MVFEKKTEKRTTTNKKNNITEPLKREIITLVILLKRTI